MKTLSVHNRSYVMFRTVSYQSMLTSSAKVLLICKMRTGVFHLVLDARLEVTLKGERLFVLELVELDRTATKVIVQLSNQNSSSSSLVFGGFLTCKRDRSSKSGRKNKTVVCRLDIPIHECTL